MGHDLTLEKFEYIPARVTAAMGFVEQCRLITEAIHCCGGSTQGRELTAPERAAYEAALNAVRLYFAGEMDFGGAPMRAPEPADKPASEKSDKAGKKSKLCKACKEARRDGDE